MEDFRIETDAGLTYAIAVEEIDGYRPDLVRTLVDIDLQTFSESTFSHYTAAALLQNGRVFLLTADGRTIGTCVCLRTWDRPNEVSLLSMGIRPGWRGRGLGQRFVRGVLSKLQARGLRAVTLMVSCDNRRALTLYEEVGFESTETTITDPRTGEDFLVMRAQLETRPVSLIPE